MAIVTIPEENRVLQNPTAIAAHLANIGITYERWELAHDAGDNATPAEVLRAYGAEIETLKRRGGYVTADVIDVGPQTPNLEAMLAKFSCEHWHDEDEVRFIICGRGLFHIRPRTGPVTVIEVQAGDLISVPKGTWHWFDLCGDHRIKAIRLFQDVSGWTPHYTGSGVDRNYQPVCLGPAYLPPQKG
jgi:1,2-dihydroxy-3-keto-5-methylthiopentene dioxygenase